LRKERGDESRTPKSAKVELRVFFQMGRSKRPATTLWLIDQLYKCAGWRVLDDPNAGQPVKVPFLGGTEAMIDRSVMWRLLHRPTLWYVDVVQFLQSTDGGKSASCADQLPIQEVFQGNADMAEGTIKKVMDKGFGFIKTASDKDLFFHSSAVQGVSFNELREGQKVTYSEGMGQKGPCAENVRPA